MRALGCYDLEDRDRTPLLHGQGWPRVYCSVRRLHVRRDLVVGDIHRDRSQKLGRGRHNCSTSVFRPATGVSLEPEVAAKAPAHVVFTLSADRAVWLPLAPGSSDVRVRFLVSAPIGSRHSMCSYTFRRCWRHEDLRILRCRESTKGLSVADVSGMSSYLMCPVRASFQRLVVPRLGPRRVSMVTSRTSHVHCPVSCFGVPV